MGRFTGYTCDSCGSVVTAQDRTRRTTKIEGPVVSGEYVEDFCPGCVAAPEHVELKPLRRRRASAKVARSA